MKIKILFLIFVLFLFGCSSNQSFISSSSSGSNNNSADSGIIIDCSYVLKGNNVYVDDIKNWTEDTKEEDLIINGADSKTFKPIACYGYGPEGGGYKIGIDKANLYYDQLSLTGVDIGSFKLLTLKENERPYYKDKNHVYIFDEVLKNADPKTFQLLIPKSSTLEDYSPIYSKDKNHVYFSYELIQNADPSSFEVICSLGSIMPDSQIAKDKNHTYVDGEVNDNFNLEECN